MVKRPTDWPLVTGHALDVRPDLSADPWRDLNADDLRRGELTRVALLPEGTTDACASVALLAVLDDGTQVVIETTWRLLRTAVRAIAASPAGQREDGR
jgi:hypothetical protein